MGLTYAQRMWPAVTDLPKVELLNAAGAVVTTINLDVVRAEDAVTVTTPVMDDRMELEKTKLVLADGRTHNVPHGYRFKVDLYWNITNKYGRHLLIAILDHCNQGLNIKFYPNRGNIRNFHVCQLGDMVNVDRHPELYGLGYQLELSLEGVLREPTIGTYVPDFWSDFTDVGFAYIGGDRVRDFASVAAAYLVTDYPAYFSPYPSKGNPNIPSY